jgi:hypothetical protein
MKAAGARFFRRQLVGKNGSMCYIFFLGRIKLSLLASGDELGSEPANGDEMRDLRRENFLFESTVTH